MSVALTPLSAAHREGVEMLWGDLRVIRCTNLLRPCGREEARARLEQLLSCERGLSAPVLFAVLAEGRFCGIAGCPPIRAEEEIFGFFYQLLPAFWGRGIGFAAAKMTLERLEAAFPAAVVYADAAAENLASVKILESLGFSLRRVRPGAFCREGVCGDILDYMRSGGTRGEKK